MWGHACFLKNHSLLIFDSNNFLTSSSTSTFFLLLGDALWRCFPFFKFDFLKFYFLYFYLVHLFVCLFLPSLPPLSLFLSFFQNFCFIAETVFHVELFLSTLMSFSFFFLTFLSILGQTHLPVGIFFQVNDHFYQKHFEIVTWNVPYFSIF